MIVADGSALVTAAIDTSRRGYEAQEQLLDGAAAPHLADAEIGQAMRNLVLRGRLDAGAGEASIAYATALITERHAHHDLMPRAWELRHNVSFHDGLYVALAEALDVPLVTADARVAGAHVLRCQVRVI